MIKLSLILVFGLILGCGYFERNEMNHNLFLLVEAERSFASASRAKGIRDAFLKYLDDDAIAFRPKPVKAKPFYVERQHIPGSLSWYPIHADVSLAGDLGYTTGPFEYRITPEKKQADECGFFVSIWKKQTDENWRVLLDAGIECPCSDTFDSEFTLKKQTHQQITNTIPKRKLTAEKSKLLESDYQFSNQIASKGIVNAYQNFSADDIRLYRNGMRPIVGEERVGEKLNKKMKILSMKPMASDIAKSGEIGYTYGIAGFTVESGEQKSSSYLRIWKKNRIGRWKIVLDLENPIPTKMDKVKN